MTTTEIMREDDLELKELSQYYGTQQYHKCWLGVSATDGVAYVMANGYSWLITDAISVIKCDEKLKEQEFLAIKLKLLGDKKAVMTIDDGNNNILYTQKYEWTDAKRELTLYFADNVIMLSGEY